MTELQETGLSKQSCVHCGGSHRMNLRRCPITGRALGGDVRLLGQLIDRRYRIVRLLGDGPFGAVYKAEHITVGRPVALRILPPALLEHPTLLNRFFREARLVSSVSHPRLQPLLDAGLAQDGVAYVAYQYVRGRSLTATIARDAPLSVPQAATIAVQILEGIEAIHQSGFVHRAIAPDSVLLQSTALGREQVLLTNFGAAAFDAMPTDASLAVPEETTPIPTIFVPSAFVPPERHANARGDRREDIFAAGMILAACLSPVGMIRSPTDLIRGGISPALTAILSKATHTSPSARYSSATEMLASLRPYATLEEDEPASATRTHISDLRTLSRRERSLGLLSSRTKLLENSGAHDSRVIDEALCAAILSAIKSLSGARWAQFTSRLPFLEPAEGGAPPRLTSLELSALLEEADALMGASDRLLCTATGEAATRASLSTQLQQEYGRMPPELFFDQIAPRWGASLSGGNARVSQISKGYGRLEIRDQHEPTVALCACLTGMLSEALLRLGSRNVEVNKTACEAVGDPACIFTATWL